MEADYVFGSTNTNTAFTCAGCLPVETLEVRQCHILINALASAQFDRALTDTEQERYDNVMAILNQAIEVNQ